MLNIPDEVKALFKLDSCHKNFHVHFPNGEMDDLGNADVVRESVEFSESICSQNTFKFGKSESSTIEFETVGVPNMMGMKIECGIEVDCSSLGPEWIAGHPVDDTLPFLTPQTTVASAGADQTLVENGEIVSVYNNGFDTLEDMEVALTPDQDLHGYSKPWAGGTRKNVLPEVSQTSIASISVTKNADGSYTMSGTTSTSARVVIFNFWDATLATADQNDQIKHLPNGTYYGNSGASGIRLQVARKNGSGTSGISYALNAQSGTFTIDNSYEYNWVRLMVPANVDPNVTLKPIICLNSEADKSFEPYENECSISGSTGVDVYVSPTQDVADATTYAEDWTSQAGVAYGGKYNPKTGVLTADRVLFQTTWSAGTNATVYGNCTRKRFSFTDADDKSKKEQAICNVGSYIQNDTSSEWAKGSFFSIHNSSKYLYLSLPTDTPSDTAIQLCYYLATPVTYQLAAQDITLLPKQNYLWASNSGMIRAEFKKSEKRMYYRVPYGLFTVRSCPRDHQAMTHRKVTAYTDTRDLTTDYQRMLMSANGVDKKYTPKFQNMFYSAVGRNNEAALINVGYTRALHLQLSSNDVEDFGYYYFKSFNGTGGLKYFKVTVRIKRVAIFEDGTGTPPPHIANSFITNDAIYGIEGFENIKNENLINAIAEVLMSDYGVSEPDAYNYSNYLDRETEYLVNASLNRPKIIGFATLKDIGGSFKIHISPYLDIVDMSGLYCINTDRESVLTTISVISSITLTPWSNGDHTGHATGDPIVSAADGLDDAYINQYTAPAGAAFEVELSLKSTGSEDSSISGISKLYTFSGAVDAAKLSADYLEINALFGAQNREGGITTFNLSDTVLETLLPDSYSQFWWDEYDISPIGKIRYTLYGKKDSDKEKKIIYEFGDGQSAYDMSENTFFKDIPKKQSEIESILETSFVPHAGVISFTPIDLEIGNGLPYFEAGDCIQLVAEDGAIAKSYILSQVISGIQHLTQTVESNGGSLMNTTFSEEEE